jgi:catechol 2,3-dioxygenase-like lactoylglutathione lyase family enzyme
MASPQPSQPTFVSIAPRFGCQDLEQALAFYRRLGFQTTYQDEAFAILTRDGIDLHLNYSPDSPSGRSVCWIGVTNIEPAVSANPCRSVSLGGQAVGAQRVFHLRSLSKLDHLC